MSDGDGLVQVRLSKKALDQISEVKEEMGASTTKEVVKTALAILTSIQQFRQKDGSIVLEHEGKRIRIIIP